MARKRYLNGNDWARIFALAWTNQRFKAALEKDPAKAIAGVKRRLGLKYTSLLEVPKPPGDLTRKQLENLINEDGGGEVGYVYPPMCC